MIFLFPKRRPFLFLKPTVVPNISKPTEPQLKISEVTKENLNKLLKALQNQEAQP